MPLIDQVAATVALSPAQAHFGWVTFRESQASPALQTGGGIPLATFLPADGSTE